MVWKSYPFLQKWIAHYGAALGKSNLFVLAHGDDEKIREICADVNLWTLPREFSVDFDPVRWQALSRYASGLTRFFKAVVVTDCDELLVVDPHTALSLSEFLLSRSDGLPLRALGFNALPEFNKSGFPFIGKSTPRAVDWSLPLSTQFKSMNLSLEYSKTCVVYGDVEFHPGGHALLEGDFAFAPELILFHLKYLDLAEWDKVADELCKDIATDVENGGDKHKIGTHWRKGASEVAAQNRAMTKAKLFDGDYLAYAASLIANTPYNSENRRAFRKAPTRGLLPDRFVGTF